MGLNFDVKIDSHIIEKIYNIHYYSYTTFKNFSVGVFLIRELQKVKEIVEANPHIGKKVQTNISMLCQLPKQSYIMTSYKIVKTSFSINTNLSNRIKICKKIPAWVSFILVYVLCLITLLLLLWQVMFDQYVQ